MKTAAALADESALSVVQRGFYSNDIQAAVDAGQAFLASMNHDTADRQAQARRARMLLWLARCARRADQPDKALERACAGIAAAKAAGDHPLECLLRAQYVHVLASLGQNETALEEGFWLLRQATDGAGVQAQAAAWLALGHAYWSMQHWSEGENAYGQALALAEACGDAELCGLASNGMAAMKDHDAATARAAGRVAEAQAHARHSIELVGVFIGNSLRIGDTYNAWIGEHNRARSLFALGDHQGALKVLDAQLLELDKDNGSRRHLILQARGEIALAEHRHAAAIAYQTEALAIAERLQQPALALDACRSLVEALEASGDLRAALAQHRRYHALYVQLASNRAQVQARAIAVKYEADKSLALAETQRRRAEQLASANDSLVEEKALLQRESTEDPLTGIANRRRFDRALERALSNGGTATGQQALQQQPIALALIDVDHFKQVNDGYSHLVGDAVLQRLGALLQRCCRQHDLAARYGGEEFTVIFANADAPTARAACERLRAQVEADDWDTVQAGLRITVSIGVVHQDEAGAARSPQALLAIADARLYAAKRGGRNRVVGEGAAPA